MSAEIAGPRTAQLTFAGEVALVTGAASGIGAATARALAAAGLRTISIDLREPRPQDGPGVQVPRSADVTDLARLREVVAAECPDGRLSYVVNCAGIIENTGFVGVSQESWRRTLDVNLVGPYNVLEAAGPFLRQSPAAAVVNVGSIEAAHVVALSDPDPNPHYAASKAGLRMLTKTTARALSADGVRVNSVSPGFVATPMAVAHGDTDELPPALRDRVPLGRFATAEDISDAIVYLLSDQAAFVTGADLRIDGGFALT